MKKYYKSFLTIFGCWSLYVIAAALISNMLWNLYGYGLWENKDVEKSILYTFLSGSVDWYINVFTLLVTILISLILSISSIVMLFFKSTGKLDTISYAMLIAWFILYSVNSLLWIWLLAMQ